MSEVCTDNRFQVIAAYKKKLMERTNIETSPDEMAVIDNVLFRFWQLGWLPPVPHGALIDRDGLFAECPELVNGYKAITDYLVVVPAEEATTQEINAPTTYDLLYEEGGYNSNGV